VIKVVLGAVTNRHPELPVNPQRYRTLDMCDTSRAERPHLSSAFTRAFNRET
jgi:hypothetical protein